MSLKLAMETVLTRKAGGANSIGFVIDPIVMEKYGFHEGDIIRISILQVIKKSTHDLIDLKGIGFSKRISIDRVIVMKKKLAEMFNIEIGDALNVEFAKS